jgi:hypothetical protein
MAGANLTKDPAAMSEPSSSLPADETLDETEAAEAAGSRSGATALLVGVSLGILAGVALVIALRPPARRARIAQTLHDSGERLAEILDSAAGEIRKPLERTRALAADARVQASKAISRIAARKKGCCFWS